MYARFFTRKDEYADGLCPAGQVYKIKKSIEKGVHSIGTNENEEITKNART